MPSVLPHGAKSDSIRALQAATNRRLRARDLDALTVDEDGVLGVATLEAVRKAAWALGAHKGTYDAITREREVPVGVQRMIRNPGRRNDRQIAAGKARMSQMRAARKRRAEARKRDGARARTVNAFLAKVGTREQPPGSNGGPFISMMQARFGFGRVPWCGIACGYFAETVGGLDVQSDVASVAAIEMHARRGHAPYGRWVSNVSGLLPGAFIVIGGHGVHVGMKVDDWRDGGCETVEGNTSFGSSGSQSNGGCIAHRFRTRAEIFGGAAMDYPN